MRQVESTVCLTECLPFLSVCSHTKCNKNVHLKNWCLHKRAENHHHYVTWACFWPVFVMVTQHECVSIVEFVGTAVDTALLPAVNV